MKYLLPILAIFFFSCKPQEVISQNNEKVEYIHKLVPVILPVETASARAVLECNAEGMVLLSRLNIETSRNARLSLLLDSVGNLSVNTIVERDTLYLPSDSIIITRNNIRTEIEYREKELTGWQKTKQEAGGIAIGGCVALVVSIIVYLFLRFKKIV